MPDILAKSSVLVPSRMGVILQPCIMQCLCSLWLKEVFDLVEHLEVSTDQMSRRQAWCQIIIYRKHEAEVCGAEAIVNCIVLGEEPGVNLG